MITYNAYTWDRANRLLNMGGIDYAYNGDGNRISQATGVNVTQYLLDLQPGLAQVLGDSAGNHYLQSPRGLHAITDGTVGSYPLTDGLGSVRGYHHFDTGDVVYPNNMSLLGIDYSEYGVPDTSFSGHAFTGEWRDANALQYHRARYYSPSLGLFPSLDPFEGTLQRPMSLNGYSWVEGNVANAVDPSGKLSVHIWASAFIMPSSITFIHWDDPYAQWHGDGRPFYSGGKERPSARAWFDIQFDTNDIYHADTNADTGRTWVTYNAWSHLGQRITESAKAPAPTKPVISCYGNDYIAISMATDFESGKNPLNVFAPPIELDYKIRLQPSTGVLEVIGKVDRFPWHELYITIEDKPVLIFHQEPLGPTYSPLDLFLLSYTTNFRTYFQVDKSYTGCSINKESSVTPSTKTLVPLALALVPLPMPIDCI